MNNYCKILKYEYFSLCKEIYPYLEDNTFQSIECKNEIRLYLYTEISKLMNLNNWKLYHFPSYQFICIDEVFKDNFLFYSVENSIAEKFYILSDTNKKYLSMEEFYNHSTNELIFSNDNDGIGIWFIANRIENLNFTCSNLKI